MYAGSRIFSPVLGLESEYQLPVNCPDFFQGVHHSVYRRHANLMVDLGSFIINFLAALTFIFQNDID